MSTAMPLAVESKPRDPLDFFATPAPVTRAILDAIGMRTIPGLTVLDPSCGDGAILNVCKERGASTVGIEIDEERASTTFLHHDIIHGDALALAWPRASLLLQNPPFSQALAFVQKAADWARENDAVACSLVRLGFMSTKGRAHFHRRNPSDAYVLAGRPSFTGDGGTDRYDYVWLVHGPGPRGRWETLEWSARKVAA